MDVKASELADKRILIASNRLPVKIDQKDGQFEVTSAVGGVATGLSSFHSSNESLWVGWPGINLTTTQGRTELEEMLREQYSCLPVYLSEQDLEKYYYGFSNRTLWPLFHYFTHLCNYDSSEWESYRKVNRMFCQKLLEVLRPDDMVWVHDYHLLLLPEMLRREMPSATIGFFLHIPFPSMEVFRHLPWREEILQGMLGADLIGFHTYDYSRHFLSAVLRLLGKEQTCGRVNVGNRMVRVETFPMGIDAKKYSEAVNTPAVQKERTLLREKINTEKIVLSVDRLDISKGILERLKAFELFLDRYPEWHERITYILLCVPSRTEVREYQQLKDEIEKTIGRIIGRFDMPGWLPILYMFRALPFEKLIALYSEADLGLVTPLRDGMNLVAKEYLACQSQAGRGTLILSETAGAAAELGEAMIVNPNNIEAMCEAISGGLSLPEDQKKASVDHMYKRIDKYNVFRWAEDFMVHLEQMKRERDENRRHFLDDENRHNMQAQYRQAAHRLLLLDFDGTLVSLQQRPEQVRPDPELLELLGRFREDQKNKVVLISGRDREYLYQWFSEIGIDLVAEHGTWIYSTKQDRWSLLERELSDQWKQTVYPTLEIFTDRTPGSFIEEKSYALVWHYRKAVPELGELRANELLDALRTLLSGTDLQVLRGSKVIEIKPAVINKGKAALQWLEKNNPHEFILAVGDDWTDEDIFEVLPRHAWTLRVGFVSFTKAQCLLEGPDEVRDLLKSLIEKRC